MSGIKHALKLAVASLDLAHDLVTALQLMEKELAKADPDPAVIHCLQDDMETAVDLTAIFHKELRDIARRGGVVKHVLVSRGAKS